MLGLIAVMNWSYRFREQSGSGYWAN